MRFYNLFFLLVLFISFNLKADVAREGFDPNSMVKQGQTSSINIMGFADSKKVKEYLKDTDFPVRSFFGKTIIVLSISFNDEFEGCGCPKSFNELAVFYHLKGEDFYTFLVGHQVADHIQRVGSMNSKFGSKAHFGEIEIDVDHSFTVRNLVGEVVLDFEVGSKGMPELKPHGETVEFQFYTAARDIGVKEMAKETLDPQMFRMTVDNQNDLSKLKLLGDSSFVVNGNTKFGAHLKYIGFKPAFIYRQEIRDAITKINTK